MLIGPSKSILTRGIPGGCSWLTLARECLRESSGCSDSKVTWDSQSTCRMRNMLVRIELSMLIMTNSFNDLPRKERKKKLTSSFNSTRHNYSLSQLVMLGTSAHGSFFPSVNK